MISATWVGGPADGDALLIKEKNIDLPVRVLTGPWAHPQERHVTPRHMSDGRWILPYYEGQIVKGNP